LLENNEVCGDVIVIGGQCHTSCCCGRSVNMHMNDAIVQTAHEFCFVVFIFSLSP
jgi:diphthamide synthase subunit DPH2